MKSKSNHYTIIIPARNEEKYIECCLDSIIGLNYPKDNVEVLVLDGMSEDRTRDIVKEFSDRYPFIKLLINEKQTAPFAFNKGIKNSKNSVIIILGAHSEMHSEYLNECEKAFEKDSAIGCVGGLIENIYENKLSQAIGSAMSSSFGVGNANFRTGGKEGYVDTVAFGAYKREVFKKSGLFDEDLTRNQDDEFNFRIIQSGFKIWLSKAIKAKYHVRASFKKLWRQYYQYGYWKVYVNKKHKTITTWRQLVPAAFVSGLFIGLFFSLLFPVLWWLYLFVLILYIFGALYSAGKFVGKGASMSLVLFSFLILHCSYGLGYLEGILRFLILRKNPAKSKEIITR